MFSSCLKNWYNFQSLSFSPQIIITPQQENLSVKAERYYYRKPQPITVQKCGAQSRRKLLQYNSYTKGSKDTAGEEAG